MAKAEPEYGTPEWYNAIALRAKARILALAKPVIAQYLKGGYAGGFAPITLATLQKMPVGDAVGVLTNMMRMPVSRANGVALFRQYLDWLQSSGQLAPGAAKLMGGAAAREQIAGG